MEPGQVLRISPRPRSGRRNRSGMPCHDLIDYDYEDEDEQPATTPASLPASTPSVRAAPETTATRCRYTASARLKTPLTDTKNLYHRAPYGSYVTCFK